MTLQRMTKGVMAFAEVSLIEPRRRYCSMHLARYFLFAVVFLWLRTLCEKYKVIKFYTKITSF